jgi:membrane-associated phospholipid phosphatase
MRKITRYLHTTDILLIAFATLLTFINIVFSSRIAVWKTLIAINCVGTVLICLLGYARNRTGGKILGYVHDWYVPPVVFISFKELYFMIKPIHRGADYDDWLIAIDRWLFGVNPTEWIMQFATPWLTELLQLAYTLFYFLFLMVGYELYRRQMIVQFRFFMFTCVYGFFLSYIGYFLLPAIGPRFTLHDFSALDTDLPGILLTPYLRWFVNAGEGVPMDLPNALAIAQIQRDVFPSGHTMMTLVLMYFGAIYRMKVRYFLYGTGALLIIATVYQRYHYVIDLLAGALLAIVCILTSPRVDAAIRRWCETMESRSEPERDAA